MASHAKTNNDFLTIKVLKGKSGFGISIEEEEDVVKVVDIRKGTDAVNKLEINDIIQTANGTRILTAEQLRDIVKSAPEYLELGVSRVAAKGKAPAGVTGADEGESSRTTKSQIPLITPQYFDFSCVNVKKESGQILGIVMANLSRDHLSAVVVTQIYENSIVKGMLQKRDIIVAINGKPVSTKNEVREILEAPSDSYIIVIARPKDLSGGKGQPAQGQPETKQGRAKIETFTILKPSNKSLGMNVSIARNEIIVGSVEASSPLRDKIKVLDRIVTVNGVFIPSKLVLREVIEKVEAGQALDFTVERPITEEEITRNRRVITNGQRKSVRSHN